MTRLIDAAVAVAVFKKPNARTRRLARGRIFRVVEHLSNVDLSILIEDHFDRAQHLRFADKELDSEIVAQTKALQSRLGGQRGGFGFLPAAASHKNHYGDEQETLAAKLRHSAPWGKLPDCVLASTGAGIQLARSGGDCLRAKSLSMGQMELKALNTALESQRLVSGLHFGGFGHALFMPR